MDPHPPFCPHFYCLNRGKASRSNLRVHSRKERHFRCTTCAKTFAATKHTPYYRLHKSLDLVTIVLTLLCHGCPRPAIVAAYGLDERTVAGWPQRAGRHRQRFHALHVQPGRVDVQTAAGRSFLPATRQGRHGRLDPRTRLKGGEVPIRWDR
jgi:transposase-like protein